MLQLNFSVHFTLHYISSIYIQDANFITIFMCIAPDSIPYTFNESFKDDPVLFEYVHAELDLFHYCNSSFSLEMCIMKSSQILHT